MLKITNHHNSFFAKIDVNSLMRDCFSQKKHKTQNTFLVSQNPKHLFGFCEFTKPKKDIKIPGPQPPVNY